MRVLAGRPVGHPDELLFPSHLTQHAGAPPVTHTQHNTHTHTLSPPQPLSLSHTHSTHTDTKHTSSSLSLSLCLTHTHTFATHTHAHTSTCDLVIESYRPHQQRKRRHSRTLITASGFADGEEWKEKDTWTNLYVVLHPELGPQHDGPAWHAAGNTH